MAFTDGGKISLFPLAFIKDCIKEYKKSHKKSPKILVVNSDDFIDYTLSCTIIQAEPLGLKVIYGDYLERGEIDLAMEIKK